MAERYRISCINKTNRQSAHERIQSIGVQTTSGLRKLDQQSAIAGIESGKWAFFVERPIGHVVDVIVATSRFGHKYLKTTIDYEMPDNLLSLPECP